MKLAIDLQACQTDSRDRGIGRYAMSLASHLVACAPRGDEVTLLLDAADAGRLTDVRRRLRQDDVRSATAVFGYPNTPAFTDLYPALTDAAGLLKSRAVEAVDADVLLLTSLFEAGSAFTTAYDWDALRHVRKAVVAYDLIPALFPERYLPAGDVLTDVYRNTLERLRDFDLILAISEATRHDLVEVLGLPEERIRMIGAGLDFGLLETDSRSPAQQDAALKSLGITGPYVLMVGNADWRKNSMGALEAFAALPRPLRDAHQLVFTRVGEDVRQALAGKYANVADRVVMAGTVDERTLGLLYRRCKVFFFPSLYEGFGLPVLEAMAMGAPVLSSSLGALPEVAHDPRILFDPRDKATGAAILRRALEDDAFRAVLSDNAVEHAHSFTWDKCARIAYEALQSLAPATAGASRTAWQPSQAEIVRMAQAVEKLGDEGEPMLRRGLECIAAGARRRILVDISEVVRLDARSGIQRVVRNYCTGLIRLAQETGAFDVEPICWTQSGIEYARTAARERLGVDIEGDDEPVRVRVNDLAFMVDSSWWSPERFDEFHAQVRAEGGEVVWMVYDLVPVLTPEYCHPGMPPAFRTWLDHVGRTADGCVCISEATRADLCSYYDESLPEGHRRPWTRALHLGSDFESGRREDATQRIRDVVASIGQAPCFVALGTVEPRKDYPTVLQAFEQLWAQGSQAVLCIVGKQGWNVDALAETLRTHPENGLRLFWLEDLPDGDVQFVLGGATALIQASRAEGYGLPVVEAGSLGIPLVLSDLAVFREIAGDEATYFPVGDAPALASLLAGGIDSGAWRHPKEIHLMTWSESSRSLAELLVPGALSGASKGR